MIRINPVPYDSKGKIVTCDIDGCSSPSGYSVIGVGYSINRCLDHSPLKGAGEATFIYDPDLTKHKVANLPNILQLELNDPS